MSTALLVTTIVFAAIAIYLLGIRARTVPAATKPAAEPLCRECTHFELEGAQQAMRLNGAFMKMTAAMTPYIAQRRVKYEDGGPCPDCDPLGNEPCTTCSGHKRIQRAIDVFPDPKVLSPHARWEEYGWCTNPKVTFDGDASFNTRLLWNGAANCDGRVFEIRKKPA